MTCGPSLQSSDVTETAVSSSPPAPSTDGSSSTSSPSCPIAMTLPVGSANATTLPSSESPRPQVLGQLRLPGEPSAAIQRTVGSSPSADCTTYPLPIAANSTSPAGTGVSRVPEWMTNSSSPVSAHGTAGGAPESRPSRLSSTGLEGAGAELVVRDGFVLVGAGLDGVEDGVVESEPVAIGDGVPLEVGSSSPHPASVAARTRAAEPEMMREIVVMGVGCLESLDGCRRAGP